MTVLVAQSLATPVIEPRQANLPLPPLPTSAISEALNPTGTPTVVPESVLPNPSPPTEASPLDALTGLLGGLLGGGGGGGLGRRSGADAAAVEEAHALLDRILKESGALGGLEQPGKPQQ
ncbi:hypothetical protein NM208_g1032 [Fusarium decemcellulare]|uniref:Uncharacterized protein n=1 Tax=Fusarium decemcellulare TaxID=57161 RepID=A0ACC1SXS1_9HYPO|nr:hypothetical protein NM208_g1032 [Fusarium decemcellulare]